jgi:putative ABC transport system ATP-binding protein
VVLIELKDVAKRYGVGPLAVPALTDVGLAVDEGEFVVVLGPSGSGKTTLLNVVGALDTASEGTVRVNGVDLGAASRRDLFEFRARAVGFVFQAFNLFPGLTAGENVQFAVDAAGSDVDPGTVLDGVGLGDMADRFPHEMSGGEQQRVAIARALATSNPVLLADEPTGELDYHTGVRILELLQRQAESGRAVLVVTHNREISRMADRVVELSSGRIVSDGSPVAGKTPVSELSW